MADWLYYIGAFSESFLNGIPMSFFLAFRGLRQGDPIQPPTL